jgi:hypothetical protein
MSYIPITLGVNKKVAFSLKNKLLTLKTTYKQQFNNKNYRITRLGNNSINLDFLNHIYFKKFYLFFLILSSSFLFKFSFFQLDYITLRNSPIIKIFIQCLTSATNLVPTYYFNLKNSKTLIISKSNLFLKENIIP